MTDSDIDRHLERLGRDVRREASLADSPRALADVRSRVDAVGRTSVSPGRGRSRVLLAVAAAVAVVVLGGVAWLTRGGDSVRTTDPPPATQLAIERPAPSVAPQPSPAPTAQTATPTSAPLTTAPSAVSEVQVRVRDVVVDAGPRPYEELFRGPADMLGSDDCNECDPMTAWGPVTTADGRVLIADEFNRRWIVVADGDPLTVAYPEGFRGISPPVVGPDGLVYIVNGNFDDSDGDLDNGEALLTAFEIGDLDTPVREVAVPRVSTSQLWFNGPHVMVNGRIVISDIKPAPVLPIVEWRSSNGPTSIVVTWNGVRRTWNFEPGQSVGAGSVAGGALPDGSVLVIDVNTRERLRLFPDGSAVRFMLNEGSGYNGSKQVSASDIVTFGPTDNDDSFAVGRYFLPPASPRTAVTATAFEATGDATEICTSAGLTVSATGDEYQGVVLHDTTSVIDGTESRWLICTGDSASGWGVTTLVSTDSEHWQLADLGLGNFDRAGDHARVVVANAEATVRYQTLVGERIVEASTSDGGVTWAITSPASGSPSDSTASSP